MKEIKLTQGKVALVDDEDFEYINQWKWSLKRDRKTSYAHRATWPDGWKGRCVSYTLHRVILEFNGVDLTNRFVDHINGNGLDNRKSNLRLANDRNSSQNRSRRSNAESPYKGMWRDGNRWRAAIGVNGKRVNLGTFSTVEEAAKAYNDAAIEYFGEFARLNKIPVDGSEKE